MTTLPKFDAAALDARLTLLDVSTQDAAECLAVAPAVLAAWRSGDEEPSPDQRIRLRLFTDEARTQAAELMLAYKRNRTTLPRAGEGAARDGVRPPYGAGYAGPDGVPVPSVRIDTGPPETRVLEPVKDGEHYGGVDR